MDWLYSEVQVWHVLIFAAIVAANAFVRGRKWGKQEVSVTDSEARELVNWACDKVRELARMSDSLDRRINYLEARVEEVIEIFNGNVDIDNENQNLTDAEIEYLYLPWWKRWLMDTFDLELPQK